MKKNTNNKYCVEGLSCESCVLLVEDKVSSIKGVKVVKADLDSGMIEIKNDSSKDISEIILEANRNLKEDGYKITENFLTKKRKLDEFFYAIPLFILFVLAFSLFQETNFLTVNQVENYLNVFVLGVIASLSQCMILIGGLILAIGNKVSDENQKSSFLLQSSFHFGRIFGFFLLGGILGFAGIILQPSPSFTIILTLIVSIVLFILGINQLSIFKRINFIPHLNSNFSKKIISLKDRGGYGISLILGILTFFLPCGFTLSVQTLALQSGNPMSSALIMGIFALGTFPVLGLLSFASVNFAGKLKSGLFLKTTGLIIIYFALSNIYNALVFYGVIK